VAVILTRSDKRSKYEEIVAGLQPLESKLHLHLEEHINCEIGLGVIHDVSSAMDWLRSTFFYIRLQSNPPNYKVNSAIDDVDLLLKQMCLQALSALQTQGLSEENKGQIHLSFHGEMAAKYCLRLPTITAIQRVKAATTLKEMVFPSSHAYFCLRSNAFAEQMNSKVCGSGAENKASTALSSMKVLQFDFLINFRRKEMAS
jgi:ATP-dependent DNA helicase HFM1/MER3